MLSADEYLRKLSDPLWYGEQDENGVDLSLIREYLKLTPSERLIKGDLARRSEVELLERGRRQRNHFPGTFVPLLLSPCKEPSIQTSSVQQPSPKLAPTFWRLSIGAGRD